MTKKNKNYYLKIIDKIEKVRGKNNVNWMNLLRLSFEKAPKRTAKILSQIYKDDKRISKLAKKLTK
tara:strand:- start:24395 stop:24592 length:198 start_codon:yes stop_codon:yes gene_type:complete